MAVIQDQDFHVDSVSNTMALARARGVAASANRLGEAILGPGGEGTGHNLHWQESWTSAGKSGPGGTGGRPTA